MDDIGSVVVGEAHEVGLWHGPTQRAWLLRIAHGAGFGRQWELNQLPEEPASDAGSRRSEPPDDGIAVATDETVPTDSLRMWWLPSARDI
jgi:hypothetical protein